MDGLHPKTAFTATPAGWYDDETGNDRWWDGSAWTVFLAHDSGFRSVLLELRAEDAPPVVTTVRASAAVPLEVVVDGRFYRHAATSVQPIENGPRRHVYRAETAA